MTTISTDIKPGYDRITSILAPFSGYDRVPSFILAQAEHRGTAVHKMFEEMYTGIQAEEFNPAYKGYYESLCRWMEGRNFLFPLDRLYNDAFMITGMIDGIYEENGELVLFDLKTSASIGKTWTEQMGGYLILLKEVNINVKRVEIIRINKKGEDVTTIEICSNTQGKCIMDLFNCERRFIQCYEIFDRFFRNKEELDLEKL
jgi:hypothetical protein